MKNLKFLALTIVLSGLSFTSHSQLYVDGQLSYNRFAGYGLGSMAIGAGMDRVVGDRMTAGGSFNFGIPSKVDRTFDLVYQGSGEYAKMVEGTENWTIINVWLDGKYFFFGDGEDGGMFGLAGLGLTWGRASYTIADYDENIYTTRYDYTEKENLFQPIIRLGLGYDLALDFGNLFFQVHGNLPANSMNGMAIDINLPFAFGGSTGVRIPIN